jgi:hypothetical protein
VLIRHDFGVDGASYARRYLEANGKFSKLLGPLLLAGQQIDQGSTWAFVPEELPRDRRAPLTDFETGHLYASPGERSARDGSNDRWLGEALDRAPSPTLICVEDALAKPSDHFLEHSDEPVFFCGESVFSYAIHTSPNDPAPSNLGGATWDPRVGIITRMSGSLANRQTLEEAAVAGLASQASVVVIGAWDAEGLIFWEPNPAISGLGLT